MDQQPGQQAAPQGPPPGVVLVANPAPPPAQAPPPGVVLTPNPTQSVATPIATPAAPAAPAAPAEQPKSLLQSISDTLGDGYTNLYKGVYKGIAATAGGGLSLLNRDSPSYDPAAADAYRKAHPEATPEQAMQATMKPADPQGHIHAVQAAADWLKQKGQTHGIMQQIGNMGENVAEFLIPGLQEDAGAKTLAEAPTYAEKVGEAAKLAKTLESTAAGKKLSGLAAIGLRTVRAALEGGAGAGAQTYVKTGGDTDEAMQAAAAGAAGGAVLHGAGEGYQAMREGMTARTAAAAAHEAAPGVLADRTAAMTAERQATAQQGVKDVAKDAARRSIDRINEAQAPPLAITGEPIGEARFQPTDSHGAAQGVNSFGDAAEQVRTAAKPVFETMDQISGGKFSKLQKQISQGYASNDFAKVNDAESQIDEMFKSRPEDVSRADYQAAKSAWRDSKVLDKLHSVVEGAFNGISEDMASQEGTGPRLLKSGNGDGGSLQKRLGALLNRPGAKTDVGRVIGQDGLTNLYRASHLVSNPELRAATQQLADEVAKQFPAPPEPSEGRKWVERAAGTAAGGILGHEMGIPYYVAAPVGAGMPDATRYVMRKMLTSPRLGKLMDYAVRNKVASKVAAPLIASELQREDQEAQGR